MSKQFQTVRTFLTSLAAITASVLMLSTYSFAMDGGEGSSGNGEAPSSTEQQTPKRHHHCKKGRKCHKHPHNRHKQREKDTQNEGTPSPSGSGSGSEGTGAGAGPAGAEPTAE